jgi:hypothetical protein
MKRLYFKSRHQVPKITKPRDVSEIHRGLLPLPSSLSVARVDGKTSSRHSKNRSISSIDAYRYFQNERLRSTKFNHGAPTPSRLCFTPMSIYESWRTSLYYCNVHLSNSQVISRPWNLVLPIASLRPAPPASSCCYLAHVDSACLGHPREEGVASTNSIDLCYEYYWFGKQTKRRRVVQEQRLQKLPILLERN